MLVNRFNLSQSFIYPHYLLYKKRFKTEINCFCIRTQDTMSSMERIMMLSEPQTSSGQMARQLSTSSTGSCQFQVGWSSSGDYKEMSILDLG